MSHPNTLYAYPAAGDLTRRPHTSALVREEEGEYTTRPTRLSDHTATVNHNLLKAEALAWVLADPLDPDHPTAETLALMAQLIREAREAHNDQWERLTDPKRED